MKSSCVSRTDDSLDVAVPVIEEWTKEAAACGISLGQRLKRCWWHFVVRRITAFSQMAITVAGWIGRRPRPIGPEGCEIMLTGRFDSANWILAHLGPLAASSRCARLSMVSTSPVPELPKVEAIHPPRWLTRVVGATQARLLTFAWAVMRKRPHVVGGFHLIFNGIMAAIAGRLAGARSVYFCVGGPAEVLDGGIHAENKVYGRMETPDPIVEKRLIKTVGKFDVIVTMGSRAVEFYRGRGVDTDFHVVSGGIDPVRFQPSEDDKPFDIILTGRLAPIKRIDVFLEAIKLVAERLPEVRAVIVGAGELRDELEALADKLGIEQNVTFAGQQSNVDDWLRRTKIFVLTSDSEGLALSMMEAMMSGLPAVVSDVGDLGDLVENGTNGYLVPRRTPQLFADRLLELLSDEQRLHELSAAARRSALRYETQATTERWDSILSNL
jgi:glycosyltransferase involved in cell wall biosynthesis